MTLRKEREIFDKEKHIYESAKVKFNESAAMMFITSQFRLSQIARSTYADELKEGRVGKVKCNAV